MEEVRLQCELAPSTPTPLARFTGATRAACVELVPGLWAITGGRSSC